jgi:hypothetical protein
MTIDNRIRDNDSFVIVEISGGHGKNIMSTAVIRAIKKQYPDRKIVVVCAWDAPFFYNPNIFRFYTFGQMQYFKDDFLKEDTIIMKHDPYGETNHILRKEHLTESWCNLFRVEYDGYKPEIFINPRELEIARDKIKPDGRPIMLLQTHGGSPQGQYSKKSWYRDMPIEIAQKLVNHYNRTYRILHIKSPEQPSLQGVEPLTLPHREMYAVFSLSTKRLFIDSFAQHVAAALNLQSTVVWIGNKPEVFGYPEHVNVLPSANVVRNFNKFNYLQDDISGQIQAFPYDTVNVFDINKIIEAVEKQK